MAHYARLDENNVVTQVIVVSNQDEMKNGVEDEATGIAFCAALTGHSYWKKTSYNNNIRRRYAGIGYRYDEMRDAFITPQPFPSWTLDENADWQAPVPMPESENMFYTWDEEGQQWIGMEKPPMLPQ
jgi:hypothetical protein